MSHYTQSDLASVKAAVLALATGERAVTVTLSGTRIEYGQAELKDLRSLQAEIQRDLQASTSTRVYAIKTSKGL